MNDVSYFWDYPNVVVVGFAITANDATPYMNMYCVDTFNKEDQWRYGLYKYNPVLDSPQWRHIPFDQFPKDFRAHLLLLGVT